MKAVVGRARGFTLFELLVALAVFAVFAVFAYPSLDRILGNRARLADEQRIWQELSQVFLRISDDVSHARQRSVRDAAGIVFIQAFIGRPYDSRAVGGPSLELTRGGELNYAGGAQSDLRRVAYRLSDGQLLRITWPVLDRAPVTVPLESPLLADVETFTLRFYDPNGNALDFWPPPGSATSDLPVGVEVTLAVKGVGKFRRLFLVNR